MTDIKRADVVIVGGGPAGMSAALLLARARKHVVLIDEEAPRHAVAEGVHGFLSREGIAPMELRRVARAQILAFPTVDIVADRVDDITAHDGLARQVLTRSGLRLLSRAVLLAIGVEDEHPPIDGFLPLWGKSIQHCPYCHGWEMRDQPLGVLGHDEGALHHALLLRGWTQDLVLFANGAPVAAEMHQRLDAARIPVEPAPIRALRGQGSALEAVELADGRQVPRAGLFLRPRQRPLALTRRLGLALSDGAYIRVDASMATSCDRIWAAGDCTSMMQAVIEAAAQGMRAAAHINAYLTWQA